MAGNAEAHASWSPLGGTNWQATRNEQGKRKWQNCRTVPFGRQFRAVPTIVVQAVLQNSMDSGADWAGSSSGSDVATWVDSVGHSAFTACSATAAHDANELENLGTLSWTWMAIGHDATTAFSMH